MSQSFTNLLYHLIFSTKDRRPIITLDYQPRLYDYIGGIIREVGGTSLGINGIEDHVHVVTKLRPDKALSDVLRVLKCNASGWMHDLFPSLAEFSWQRGYGRLHGEPVKRGRRKALCGWAKRASREDFVSRRVH